jgi:recombinational DNA repair protein (RecF pathway)
MQTVRLHVDGAGTLWALTKCRVCGEVHKYQAVEVAKGPVICKSCHRQMEIAGATVERAIESEARFLGESQVDQPQQQRNGVEKGPGL